MHIRLSLLILALILATTPGARAHEGMDHGEGSSTPGMTEAGAVTAAAEIHSIDGDVVNLTHGPIPAIGWPTMTMDLSIAERVDLNALAPGAKGTITLERQDSGLFAITDFSPH